MRVEIFNRPDFHDGRAEKLIRSLKDFYGIEVAYLRIIEIYLISITENFVLSHRELKEIFADSVVQQIRIDSFSPSHDFRNKWDFLIEISYKEGVTDPVAITAREAIKLFFDKHSGKDTLSASHDISVKYFTQYLFKTPNPNLHRGTPDTQTSSYLDATGKKILKHLYNPLIQEATLIRAKDWERGAKPPSAKETNHGLHIPKPKPTVLSFAIGKMSLKDLKTLSHERLLALSEKEMMAIKNHYLEPQFVKERREKGLTEKITDVELEMIAQTWSEHCKHKIFNAIIHYIDENEEEQEINSLFNTYIRAITERLQTKKSYLKSVFHDNSGVIEFDSNNLVCFKVETHNSPSALDPYGGAITGIVGVNRDILGTGKGAKPIFNTNVLCFGYPDTPESEVPHGLLSPREVMEGVHRGIIDGGNQSGIPVAGGAFLFDNSYMGKPLVYCGTGGILPATINGEASWIKHIDPGDLAVMVGGRIGKDGIHGATFSSLSLNEESPTSAVQIGDPITQKKMSDFLLEARDRGLYKGITDNGAGGLSSSLGEMAEECGGVKIELSKCPLKYSGLQPWEILLSESQERMSLSVAPDKIKEFLALARKRDVEATVIGEFTNTGYVEIFYEDKIVGLIDLDFLHNGLPKMVLKAKWLPHGYHSHTIKSKKNPLVQTENRNPRSFHLTYNTILKELLKEPNIASKENLVRQYDHEVQGTSVIKPFMGKKKDGPTDGGVLKPLYNSERGLTVTHGICPWYSKYDTYNMALCAVDEAIRAHVAMGGDPNYAAALDNFCWPDPVQSEENPDGEYKLAQLVRACKGLQEACLEYGLPLISGKDSMKNDTVIEGKKLSATPTLLISLIGIVPEIHKSITTDFKKPEDIIFILGITRHELQGSFYQRVLSDKISYDQYNEISELHSTIVSPGSLPKPNLKLAKKLYAALFNAIQRELVTSAHDISDGGLAVALAESALGGRLGAEIEISKIPTGEGEEKHPAILLFSESPSRFIVTVDKQNAEKFKELFRELPIAEIGRVTDDKFLTIRNNGNKLIEISIEEIEKNWKQRF